MNELVISFPDQSQSFTNGVEFGRILEKMERGDEVLMNNGFPIRIENKSLIKAACENYNYVPAFGKVYYGEWVEFLGIAKCSTPN